MTIDLHICLESESPEGKIIETIASRDNVSPEAAVMHLLREMVNRKDTPAEQMWGAFSSPEDAALIEDVAREAYERRLLDQPRDFGF